MEEFFTSYQHTFGAAGAIASAVAVITSLIFSWKAYRHSEDISRKNIASLKVEIEMCYDMAEKFLKNFKPNEIELTIDFKPIISPLYRLPIVLYSNLFPRLLSEGFISKAEALPLVEYYSIVESLNRGLDNMQTLYVSVISDDINQTKLNEFMTKEQNRNEIKAKQLIGSEYFNAAISAIDSKLSGSNYAK